jgi:TPR repeat protein
VLYALDTPFHDFSKSEAWLQKAAYAPYVPPPAGAMPSTPAYYAWQQKTSAAEAALYSLWAMYRGLYFSRGVTEYDQFLTVDVPTQRDEKKLFLCILRMQERPMLGKMDEALAEMYQFGRGTPVNETKAAKLYMGVFQNGFRHPDDVQRAEAGLGLMRYSHGDLKKAYFWLSQAYDYGKPEPSDALDYGAPASEHLFPQAKLAMDRITARLTPSERAKQEAAFKAWQAALPPSSWPKPIPEFF